MADMTLANTELGLDRRSDRFDPLTIAMHWTTLLLLVAMFATAWSLKAATNGAAADGLLLAHRSTGALLWLLVLARLVWKASFGRAAALPPTVGRLQHAVARANELGLYLLLVLQPVTGLGQSLFRGKSFVLLGVSLPVIVARNRALTTAFHHIHAVGAWILLGLIALHASAALFHHFVLRDGVLRAMLPRRQRP